MMVSEQTGRDATLQNYLSETEEFGQLILITGGAYQGKSGFAQQLVRELNRESGQQEPGMQENMHWTILEDVHLRDAESRSGSMGGNSESDQKRIPADSDGSGAWLRDCSRGCF